MNDAPVIVEAPPLDGKAIAALAEQLNQLLHLRTFPIGMKLFEDTPRWRRFPVCAGRPKGKTFSTCQLVTQSRMAGFTLGITTENMPVVFLLHQRDRARRAGRDLYLGPQDGGRVVREPRGRRGAPGRDAARDRRDVQRPGDLAAAHRRGSIRRMSACSTAIRRR